MDVQVVAGAVPAASPVPPAAAAASAGSAPPQPMPESSHGALSPVLAKLFAQAAGQGALTLNVSYRVERDPDMIVTVFTDPSTGKEIAQVPAEVMVQIAQFFDKHSGVTLDESA